MVAVPAATIGIVGRRARQHVGPSDRLLTMLNEPPAGIGADPAAGRRLGWSASAIPVLAAAWPAWRAAGRPPVDAAARAPASSPARGAAAAAGAGPLGGLDGARGPAGRRPPRCGLAATVLTLGDLDRVRAAAARAGLRAQRAGDRPGGAGQALPADRARCRPRAPGGSAPLPGVQAAAPRYEVQALDSFSLGETIDVIAYPGDHTDLRGAAADRRARGCAATARPRSAPGSPTRSGCAPGRRWRSRCPSGTELRLRVAGVVSSLDHDGRVAYVPAAAAAARPTRRRPSRSPCAWTRARTRRGSARR